MADVVADPAEPRRARKPIWQEVEEQQARRFGSRAKAANRRRRPLAVVYEIDGPRIRLGVLWFLANIGAGTIAVNYDGYGKWRTVIGAEAFVGSNSSLVAPLKIGRGANVTAGSVVTEDVPAGAVAFGRARQETKKGRAAPLRAKLKARAAATKRARNK